MRETDLRLVYHKGYWFVTQVTAKGGRIVGTRSTGSENKYKLKEDAEKALKIAHFNLVKDRVDRYGLDVLDKNFVHTNIIGERKYVGISVPKDIALKLRQRRRYKPRK